MTNSASERRLTSPYHQKNFFEKTAEGFKKNRSIFWFLIPAMAFSLIFSYIPMFGVTFAFKDTSFNDAMRRHASILGALIYSHWTLNTFASIFDNTFWAALSNSLIINLLKLFLIFPLSIILAIQLADMKSQKLAKLILIILCIPDFLSWTVVIKIWTNFFNPDTGLLGRLLAGVTSGNHVTYFEASFKPLFLFYAAWKGTGWGSILYYAAITSIDKSFYEAATVEGANLFQKAIYLTIPSIGATIALMMVLSISGFTSVGLEQAQLMLNGASYYEKEWTLDLYIWQLSIGDGAGVNYVQAAAVGVFNGFVSLFLMLTGNVLTTKFLHEGLW